MLASSSSAATPNRGVARSGYQATSATPAAAPSPYAEPDSPIASISRRGPTKATPAPRAPAPGVTGRPSLGSPPAIPTAPRTGGGVAPPRVAGTPGSGAALFSPKFDGDHNGPSTAAPTAPSSSSAAGSTSSSSAAKSAGTDAIASGASAREIAMAIIDDCTPLEQRIPPTAVMQTTPIHTYQPPSMNCIYRALQVKHAGQIRLSDMRKDSMGDEGGFEEEEYDPFIFIKNLVPLSTAVPTPRKSPIPRKSSNAPPVTLALDLDETLVHCSIQPIDNPEFTFHVNFNGMDYEVFVRIRPHLEYFLKQVAQWFEVVVFTASQKVYADTLLNIIDPRNEYVSHRVFRDSCVCVDGNYLKDLNILGRPLDRVVIVDNSFQAFGFQLDNGIPIESWFDDEHDCELLNLIPFLRHLKDVSDVRPHVRSLFRLQEFVDALVPPINGMGMN